MRDVCPSVIDYYIEYFLLMYGTNLRFWSVVRFTHTASLVLDHPLPAEQVNELCGLCCCVLGSMCPSVST